LRRHGRPRAEAAPPGIDRKRIDRNREVLRTHSVLHQKKGIPATMPATANMNAEAPNAEHRPYDSTAWSRIAEIQAEALDLMARGAKAPTIIDRIARGLDPLLAPSAIAIIALGGNGRQFETVVAPGLPSALASALLTPMEPQHGPAAAALLCHAPITVADCATDDRWDAPLREALAQGYSGLDVQPLFNASAEPLGAVAIFHPPATGPAARQAPIVDMVVPLAAVVLEYDRRAAALHLADERLSSLAANLPGVIYQRIVHPDGHIRYNYVSEGVRDLFGVTPTEILADPNALFSRHIPEYRDAVRKNLLMASRELRMWDIETQIAMHDGQEKWIHAKARPRRQPDGSVIWDGIILDATRNKEASLALAAANRAKSEFLATMSHELRTPLNAIIGFSEIILTEAMGPIANTHYREYLTDIHESGKHLLSLIKDILDLSKIEAGHLDLDEEVINVCTSIEACLRLVKPRADKNGLAISFHCEITKPELRGDERKFRQIVTNLLSNAVKFTPDGGTVAVSVQEKPGMDLEIAITDTGIGIPTDSLSRICKPFVQVDGGNARKFEGTGLGLALAKALTEAHGGKLAIESQVGVGTRVSFSFPAARRLVDQPAP